MALAISPNPGKSFRFVKAITSVVAQEVRENSDPKRSRPIGREGARPISPQQIRNKSQSSTIKRQERLAPQDRFIDIVV